MWESQNEKTMNKEELYEELIKTVICHIEEDMQWGETEAIEELLKSCSTDMLVKFLPEEEWKQFEQLK